MNKQDRVMLQYSVQLDEVPSELKRLIERAEFLTRSDLEQQFKKLKATDTTEILQQAALVDVARLRTTIANIDVILSDTENIINGYISMNQEEEQHMQTEQEVEPTIDTADDLDNILDSSDLSETISLFKQQQGSQDATKPAKDSTSK